jgi:predicted GTPase
MAPGLTTAHKKRVLILGAAGRDYHEFNTTYRDDSSTQVVAFTHAQVRAGTHEIC